jgi:hypothetical protein
MSEFHLAFRTCNNQSGQYQNSILALNISRNAKRKLGFSINHRLTALSNTPNPVMFPELNEKLLIKGQKLPGGRL